jgi:sugar lactone lactonase YvrE
VKKLTSILCFLGLAWSLLAANHFSLQPTKSSLLAMDPDIVDITQVASKSAVPSLLFADDFEHGIANWDLDGEWDVQTENANHVLHGVAFANARAETSWDDYRVEVRGRVLSGTAKIAFRVGELHAGYYLGLHADGELFLEKWDGTGWTSLGSDAGPYLAGQWYTLVLEGKGSQLRAYANGELRIQASDASYAYGFLMLHVASGEADFDDVWVIGDAPAACAIVPASGLNTPQGIDFSPQGELYVCGGPYIYHIHPDGMIEPVAIPGCPGDIAFDSVGTLYLYNCEGRLGRMLPDGSLEFFATLPRPSSMTMSPNDEIFVSAGGGIYCVTLDGSVELLYPDPGGDIAFDPWGNLFVEHGGSLYKINPEGDVSAVADLPDTGPGASFISLAVDGQGNAYLGQGIGFQGDPTMPPYVPPVCVDEVYRITPDGEATVFATVPGGAAGLTFGPDGMLYATEWNNGGLSRISSDGNVTPIVPGNGLALVGDIAYSPDGTLYILNIDGWTVARLTVEGQIEIIASGLNLESTGESQPALTFDGAGNMYVAESSPSGPQRITKFTPEGMPSVYTNEADRPSGLAFHPTSGDLYISEALSGQILRFTIGNESSVFAAGLENPHGITFGPDSNLYVAEPSADRVSLVTPSGEVSTFVSNLEIPRNVIFSGSDLLVATGTSMVWRVTPGGAVSLHATGPSDSRGIGVASDGSTVVSFFLDDSIYRFIEGGTAPGVEVVAPATGFGQAGQVVTHTFTVQNTGNGLDGFWLAAESEYGWPLEIQGETFVGPIDCRRGELVQVRVTIPGGTAVGTTDTLTLTATSRLSPDVYSSAQAKTVSSYQVYMPLILKSAG